LEPVPTTSEPVGEPAANDTESIDSAEAVTDQAEPAAEPTMAEPVDPEPVETLEPVPTTSEPVGEPAANDTESIDSAEAVTDQGG
jgi:hypothetical protein